MSTNNIRLYRPISPRITKDSTLIEDVETAIKREIINSEFRTAKNKFKKLEFEKKRLEQCNLDKQKEIEEEKKKEKKKKKILINEEVNKTLTINMTASNERKRPPTGSLQAFFTKPSSSSHLLQNNHHHAHHLRRMSASSHLNYKEKKMKQLLVIKPSKLDAIKFNDKNWVNQPQPYNSMNQNIQVFMDIGAEIDYNELIRNEKD